jgi:hypothetical protein
MRSWEVRLATALVWLGVLPAAGCLYLSALAFKKTDDMLLFVMPLVASFLLCAGLFLMSAVVSLGLRLQRAHPSARLQTALVGGAFVVMSGFALAMTPSLGLLLLLYGGALAYLMTTPGAASDLGPWRRAVQQPAPWGATPGRGIWAPSPPQSALHPSVPAGPVQGPWAPDPTTLPWFSWKEHTGPRAPWWQTWQLGLAQGIPLWELVLLCLALLSFLVGLVAVPFVLTGSAYLGSLHVTGSHAAPLLLLLPASWLLVAWLEQRMRARLAGRR